MHDQRRGADVLHELEVGVNVEPDGPPVAHRRLQDADSRGEGRVQDDPSQVIAQLCRKLTRGPRPHALAQEHNVPRIRSFLLDQVLPARPDVGEGVPHARLARRPAIARIVVPHDVHPQVFAQVAVDAVHDPQVDCVSVRVQDGLGLAPGPARAADVDGDDGFPSPAAAPPLSVQLHHLGPSRAAPDEGALERQRAALLLPQRVRWRRGREERQQRRRPVHYLRPDAHACGLSHSPHQNPTTTTTTTTMTSTFGRRQGTTMSGSHPRKI
mmetsp:Transcript_5989/g.14832  ORF Transcript_5989/g.14832 Transcript_5989/m.14832 type:complete len:269 (-) Transcript_5989:159-965(-)